MTEDSQFDGTKVRAAATKIQANFRGYRVRKKLCESKEKCRYQELLDDRPARSQLPVHRQKEKADEDEEAGCHSEETEIDGDRGEKRRANPDIKNPRTELEERSAIKIQAGVRGFLVRKRQKTVRVAATRIQAGFRKFRSRKTAMENQNQE